MTPLRPEQVAALAEMLDAGERALKSDVHAHVANLRDTRPPGLEAPAGDAADVAEAGQLRENDSVAVLRDVRALRDIELARERIDAGLAGVCVDCELPIPFERLRLQPAAVRCVECQEALERRSARQPDGSPTLQV